MTTTQLIAFSVGLLFAMAQPYIYLHAPLLLLGIIYTSAIVFIVFGLLNFTNTKGDL